MANVTIENGRLRIELTPLERLAALHGNIAVPLDSVAGVQVLNRALDGLRGIRAPGSGWPEWFSYGTRRGRFGRDFAAVAGNGPGVTIDLNGGPFRRIVVSVAEPDAIRDRLSTPARM